MRSSRSFLKRAEGVRVFICLKEELTHWNAKGGSVQARPGEPTMRITSWLFAFVSIQTCLYKVEITFAGQTAGPSPFIVSCYCPGRGDDTLTCGTNPPPHVNRLSVKLQTDWTQSNRDNDGERLHTSKWWSLMTCHLPAWFNKMFPHWPLTLCPGRDLGWSS